jgi:hypothetical protein
MKIKKKMFFRPLSKTMKRFLSQHPGVYDRPGSGNLCSAQLVINSGDKETVTDEELPESKMDYIQNPNIEKMYFKLK